MRISRFLALTALFSAVAGLQGPALAQEYYPGSDQGEIIQVSSTHLNSLVERIEALEAEAAFDGWEGKGNGKGNGEGVSTSGVTMKIFGRIHWDYWGLPLQDPLINTYETGNPALNPPDRFTFRRLRIGAGGKITNNMIYKFEMEFANPNDTEFRDAYIGWEELPILHTLLLGNQKRPYGLDHLNSSRYNVFIERPFIIEGNNQDARRLGLASYGVSDDERWNWRYGPYLQQIIQPNGTYTGNHYQAEFAGRLANTIWYDECSDGRGYAHWAVSGTIADPNPNAGDEAFEGENSNASNSARFRTRPEGRTVERWLNTGRIANVDTYQLLGLEGVLNIGAFSLVGEYQWVNLDRLAGDTSLSFHGGYVYAAYWLTGEHTPWSRKSGTLGRTKPNENFFSVKDCCGGHAMGLGAWQIAARYSYADYTDDNVFGGVGEAVTIGLNWWWNDHARMQFNYIHGRITEGMEATNLQSGADEVVIFNEGGSGDYDIFGARFMIDF